MLADLTCLGARGSYVESECVAGAGLTEDGQRDVDEQVDATAALEEDTDRREDDGEDDFANVTAEALLVFCSECLRKPPDPEHCQHIIACADGSERARLAGGMEGREEEERLTKR